MCKWGTEIGLTVTIPARLSFKGVEYQAIKGIDACIADLVKALNSGGIRTVSSCCGHGKRDGEIQLNDGRVLIVRSRQ